MSDSIKSQANYEQQFLTFFNQQNFAGKVRAFDTLDTKYKLTCYPLIKNELRQIRKRAILDNRVDILDRLVYIDGEIYFMNRKYASVIPLFTDLLAKNKAHSFNDSARVLSLLKNSYIHLHALSKAVEIHKVLMNLKQNHSEINEWLLHPQLSTIYYEMNLYSECLKQQLLEYDDIKHDNFRMVGFFNNRGLFWGKFGKQDSAIVCFNRAKELFFIEHKSKKLTTDDEFVLGLIEGNIGQSLIVLKEYVKAIPLLKKDINSSYKAKNYLNVAISQTELAKCYLELNLPELSKKYLDSANTNLLAIDDYHAKLNMIKQYANYYYKIGSYRSSIDFQLRYNAIKDSVEKQENFQELMVLQVANQVEENENLIIKAQQKIEDKISELQQQKKIRNFAVFGGFILVLIILVISYQLKRTNTQAQLLQIRNKQIKTRNEIINKSLFEKDLLIKEIHHRVKNNLQIISSLLKLQAGKSTNKEVQYSLQEAHDRVNSMALLHQLLYKNNNMMTSIYFNEYLSNLIVQISNSFYSANNKITVKTKFIELELDLDIAIPLGLITNELISNAYKHAFNGEEGTINIELSRLVKNTFQLKINDNGKGLPADFNISHSNSLGLDIVSILVEQLNAELKIDNSNGVTFEIIFKL